MFVRRFLLSSRVLELHYLPAECRGILCEGSRGPSAKPELTPMLDEISVFDDCADADDARARAEVWVARLEK